MRLPVVLVFTLGLILTNCSKERGKTSSPAAAYKSEEFRSYWHAGKAEVNSYSLIQPRYGEERKGDAVLIFVTEDLSRKSQVKLDEPEKAGVDKVNVLKLNFTKHFITGIYPYSMMLSVFTPVNHDHDQSSQKVTMSAQEWCGQVYTQMNLRGNRYNVKSHSYFETEADDSFSVKKELLEDEIWNIIRLDHAQLPEGEINILPGLFFSRLNHLDLRTETALAKKSESDSTFKYLLSFETMNRKLSIEFQKTFPYKILGWKESWSERGKQMQASGTLRQTLYLDYWNKNSNDDEYLRDSLQFSW